MGNPFSKMLTAEVKVQKPDGSTFGPFKGTLTNKKLIVFDPKLDATEGDKILRELPNGKVESFTVLEMAYQGKFHGIPAHFTLELRKDASLAKPVSPQTINISHSQGIQIGDHNIQNIVASLKALVDEIDRVNASPEQKTEAKSRLKDFLSHPLVTAIGGGAISGLLAAL